MCRMNICAVHTDLETSINENMKIAIWAVLIPMFMLPRSGWTRESGSTEMPGRAYEIRRLQKGETIKIDGLLEETAWKGLISQRIHTISRRYFPRIYSSNTADTMGEAEQDGEEASQFSRAHTLTSPPQSRETM